MRIDVFLAFGLFFALGDCFPRQEQPSQPKCGYQACTKSDPQKLNIHLVSHTHDDVGWLKTVDQYYYGARMDIQVAGVQYIIDSVVEALLRNPNRKFIYVETAFLWKWWEHQDDDQRAIMRQLINEGRLEIIGGGWSMNDEAVTHYHSMIDQYTWGFRRLNDTFGTCARPKIGWQIDPFGHSREQAAMFAQMGFDGMLFGRLDYQDKKKRLKSKTAEFIWEGSSSLGESANLFTTMLYNNYGPPPGFCFDILCQDSEPIIDDPNSPDYNIDTRIQQFLKLAQNQSAYYRTNNIILTMGGDFTYQYAEMYFKNLDKLIRYINKDTNYNAFYSTPSCYLKSLNEQNLTWPVKSDDFFPYASDPHAFWTGYFTSRPTIKYFERMGNNFLQIVKQMSVIANLSDSLELQEFREAMGVMQHHDAVTGTEKQHVAEDYSRLLYRNMMKATPIVNKAFAKLATKNEETITKLPLLRPCLNLNISECQFSTNNERFVVTAYNPTGQPLTTYIRIPVKGVSFKVQDFSGKELVTQVVPIPDPVQNIPGRQSAATKELIFEATNISPLGYQSFYITQKLDGLNNYEDEYSVENNIEFKFGDLYNVSINEESEVIIRSLKTKKNLEFRQSFHYYEGMTGNNLQFKNRSSGAYIFRPKENFTKDLPTTGRTQFVKGPLITEVHLVVNEWVSQVIKMYTNKTHVEFDWLVGPIPIENGVGKEVITKYKSSLKNNGEFYTDSNGREMLKRKLNYRPTWELELEEPIAGNYYPVTTKMFIQDIENNLRLSVLTDRSQGGSSLQEGNMELMIHRRLLHDDAFGVDEALNETAFGTGLVARGQHYLVTGNFLEDDELILQEKQLATELALRPWLFFTPVEDSFEEWSNYYKMKDNGSIKSLPKNIRLLTLEPWHDGEVLLRLEHVFEKNESSKYSTEIQVNLKELFPIFNIDSVQETTLGANQWLENSTRLIWHWEMNDIVISSNGTDESTIIPRLSVDSPTVVLKPMEIRTFILKISAP